MRTLVLATLSLAIPPALAAQTGQFVVRLGNDTLAIEQYTRTRDRLQGEQAVRSPRTVHRLYSATFGSGGAIARFELVTHNVSGAPGPAETRAGAEFTGDSAVVTVPRRDSTVTLRVKAGAGAVPFIGQGFGLIEEVTRRARASGDARYTTTRLPLGDTEPMQVTVTARGPDSRPPLFETSADLVIAGTVVPAGKYSLWTLPSPGGWKLIVNKNTGQWGTDYNAQYDLARLDMGVEQLPQPVEQFTIAIEPRGTGGVLKLEWDHTRASVPFSRK